MEKLKHYWQHLTKEKQSTTSKLDPTPLTGLSREMLMLRSRLRRDNMLLSLMVLIALSLSAAVLYATILHKSPLVVLHDSDSGVAWISEVTGPIKPTQAATNANLARYVRLRESYAATVYPYQYRQVNLWSSSQVALTYRREQLLSQASSLPGRYGRSGVKKVQITGIVSLPFSAKSHLSEKAGGHPFSEVHFTTWSEKRGQNRLHIAHHTALIAWGYKGLPRGSAERLNNWMGFQVYYYRLN